MASKSSSKKLVRNPNTPSLKSQDAGYSTTNRKGETTFYKSSKDAPGYNDTNQSRANMSKGTPMSTFDSKGKVITSASIQPTPQVKFNSGYAVDGLDGGRGGNASLAGNMGATYDNVKGQIVPAPTQTPTDTSSGEKYLKSIFDAQASANQDAADARFTMTDAFKAGQKEIRPLENVRNSIAGQLNVIQADSQAAQLSLEGQGRGQTGGFIGGEQARINREAAIKSMPLQAQLAIAQDDLESARSYYTQYYQAKAVDSQNEYNLLKENNANLAGFLTAQETRRQAASEKILDRQYAETQQLITAKAEMISKALGQGAPAAVQQAIDSATTLAGVATAAGKYNGDLLQQEAQRASIANAYDAITQRAEQNKALLGTVNGKAQTEGEKLTQVYASRMLEANDVINSIGSKFTTTRSRIDQFLPNELLSADRQKYDQAQRNFINAVLRKESGAVISPEEFTSAKLQYFPQPGDSAGVITQKQNNRSTALTGLYNAANVPMPELVQPDAVTPLKSGYKGVTTSGITYTIE